METDICTARSDLHLPNSEQLTSGAGVVEAPFKLVTRKENKEPIDQNASSGKSGKVGPLLGAKHAKNKGKDTLPQLVKTKSRVQGGGSKIVS